MHRRHHSLFSSCSGKNPSTAAIYSLSLHDALPIFADIPGLIEGAADGAGLGVQFLKHLQRTRLLLHLVEVAPVEQQAGDRKSTRLNSSHVALSYAVFCLKKKT